VRLEHDRLIVPPGGRAFLRNTATFFDEYFDRQPSTGPTYSTSA
jgi:hypothetical protein